MLKQLARVVITTALVVSAFNAVSATTDKGLPVAGSMIALEPTATGFEAFIDVTSDDGYTDITVNSDDPRLKALLSRDTFKTKTQPDRIKRIGIHLNSAALKPGPYLVTIVAVPAPAAAGPAIEGKGTTTTRSPERDIWLTVPPLTLETLPTTLVVDRICNGIYFRDACVGMKADFLPGNIKSKGFQLWVSAQHRGLSGIKVEQKGVLDSPTSSDGRIVVRGHKLDEGKPEVNPIFTMTDFDLQGNFPLGTAKGKLSINADQLAAPVQMDFEVRSRTTYFILIVALFLGLGLGWITRSFLKGRLDRTKEQKKTFVLIKLIDATLAQTGDDGFTTSLNTVRTAATDALNAKTADAIKNQTDAAQTQLLTLQAAIRARRTAVDQSFADLRAVLQAQWKLTAALAADLSTANTELEALSLTRAKGNFAAEEAALTSITSKLLTPALAEVRRCAERVSETALIKAELLPLLDVAAPVALDGLSSPGDPPAAVAPDANFSQRLAGLRAALNFVHVASSWTMATLQALRSLLLMQVARWGAMLAPAALPSREEWKAWLDTADQLAGALGEMAAKADDVPLGLTQDAKALIEALKIAIRAQFEPDDAAVSAMLDQGLFAEAIAAAAKLRPVVEAFAGARAFENRGMVPPANQAGNLSTAAVPMHPMSALIFGRAADRVPNSTAALVQTSPFDAATIAVLAAASERRLESTERWLSLIYAAIIVIGGYFLFKDKWVGTSLDFAVAFFWAYASDIGSDAATAAARGLKK